MTPANKKSCHANHRAVSAAHGFFTRFSMLRRGQAMVEFAMVAVVGLMVLVVAVQYAMIGQAALALSQAAFQGARYASVNPSATKGDVQCYLTGGGTPSGGGSCSATPVASPTITKNGGQYLTFDMTPTTTPRTFSTTITVTLTFDVCKSGTLILGKSGNTCSAFLGLNFPKSLTATETAMSE